MLCGFVAYIRTNRRPRKCIGAFVSYSISKCYVESLVWIADITIPGGKAGQNHATRSLTLPVSPRRKGGSLAELLGLESKDELSKINFKVERYNDMMASGAAAILEKTDSPAAAERLRDKVSSGANVAHEREAIRCAKTKRQ